jgi:hypothetical protein
MSDLPDSLELEQGLATEEPDLQGLVERRIAAGEVDDLLR